ncbi:MAG: AAA family ATPase [Candidatus Kapabacteria bacterium]|nr:AAA family ATPase [Candidatus Kapabacteria bacterium]
MDQKITEYQNSTFDYNTFLQQHSVKPDNLSWKCPADLLNFQSTNELEPLDDIIGQPRAIEAIELGAKIKSKGYNIFVSGLTGTGRSTAVKSILSKIATETPEVFDYCYVNNFQNSDFPHLIMLEGGKGNIFAKAMSGAIAEIRERLPKTFEEDEHANKKREFIANFQQQENMLMTELEELLTKNGCMRTKVEGEADEIPQEIIVLKINDTPTDIDELDTLVENGTITFEKSKEYESLLLNVRNDYFNTYRYRKLKLVQDLKNNILAMNNSVAGGIINSVFEQYLQDFTIQSVTDYIAEVKKHILENLKYFVPDDIVSDEDAKLDEEMGKEFFNQYEVNVVLDNSATKSVPIIVENNPTYSNLFGTIDRTYDNRGFWKTDFTKIKSGALLRADNGFLIVNALELFIEPEVWNTLKRILLYDNLEIQAYDPYFQVTQLHLKPEPIKINVKVIIIGGLSLYRTLYHYEKEFKKIFKINAQFDYEGERTDEMLGYFARFITKISQKEQITPFSPDGVAAVLEWAVKHAGTKDSITLKFSDITDVLREAAFFADGHKSPLVTRENVNEALARREYRNNMTDEKLKQYILKGITLIDTDGERIGQINGLTIMDTGLFDFGKPARITAIVTAGNSGVINIEREAEMSGSIHNKAVLILSGILRRLFAQKKAMNLTASLSFEQNYGGIDGDSATAAEIYVILSALAELPIKQNIAITGSVNQLGDVQPIGGVNEKIKGFYEICKERGLTGTQGVLIPIQNVNDLMLDSNLIEDVTAGKFHIYSFSKLEEGLSIMTGMEAGELDEDGNYPENSVLGIAMQKIEELRKVDKDDIFEKLLGRRKRPAKKKLKN